MNRPKLVSLKPSFADLDGGPETRKVSVEAVQKAVDKVGIKRRGQRHPAEVAYLRKLTDRLASAWTDDGKLICNFTWAPSAAFAETDHISIC